ncbi:MAG: hypothetical protein HS111_29910 [Kofleriaceae bacterium]|nr:hypothetical protein [Kofleriaceae bacterium]
MPANVDRSRAFAGVLLSLACAACGVKLNGKTYGPGSGGGAATAAPGEPASSSGDAPGGSCTAAAENAARKHGLTGPCWDPPGPATAASPLTIARGMRAVGRTTDDHDVYWFDMPANGELVAPYNENGTGCARIPTYSVVGKRQQLYVPYDSEDGQPPPRLDDVIGMPLAEALAYYASLGKPLCVQVEWEPACERDPGTVCADQRAPHDDGGVPLTVAGRRPR